MSKKVTTNSRKSQFWIIVHQATLLSPGLSSSMPPPDFHKEHFLTNLRHQSGLDRFRNGLVKYFNTISSYHGNQGWFNTLSRVLVLATSHYDPFMINSYLWRTMILVFTIRVLSLLALLAYHNKEQRRWHHRNPLQKSFPKLLNKEIYWAVEVLSA